LIVTGVQTCALPICRGGGDVPDEPRAGQAAGDVDAEGDGEDVDGHPERIEDAPVDAARVEPVEDAAAGRRAGAERHGDGGVHREDADERADRGSDERRDVDEKVPPLDVEVEAQKTLARGVGGQWTHRDGGIVSGYAYRAAGIQLVSAVLPRIRFSESSVTPRKAMHISSVVRSPHDTALGGSFGLRRLSDELSKNASTPSFVPT